MTITHPFHPLSGRELEVIDRRRHMGGEWVDVEVGPDRAVRIPLAWTSLATIDPFVAMAAGRALFRVDALLRLAELISELQATAHGGTESPVKGNTPHV